VDEPVRKPGGFRSGKDTFGRARRRGSENAKQPSIQGTRLYIRDYDQAGGIIGRAGERQLRLHLDAGVRLDFRRLAITPEQIEFYDLPTKPQLRAQRDPHKDLKAAVFLSALARIIVSNTVGAARGRLNARAIRERGTEVVPALPER
jgi:hypothetical protein